MNPAIGSISRIQGSVRAGPESALVDVQTQRDINDNDGVHVSDSGKAKLDFGYNIIFTLYNDSTAGGTGVDKTGTSQQVIAKLSQGGLKGTNPPGSRTEVDLPDGGRIFILGTQYFIAYDPAQDVAWVYNFDGTVQYVFGGGRPQDLPQHALLTRDHAAGAINILLNLAFSTDDFDKYATDANSPIQGLNDLLNSTSPIYQKYLALGGPNGNMGAPAGPEMTTSDGHGNFRDFQGGSIYWRADTAAWEVQGLIRDKWLALGGITGFLGYPLTDETGTPDGKGRFNHFQGGSIYWTPETGAHEVHGAIRDKWASLGWENFFGYPITDETPTPDGIGRFNHFQYGSIYWSPQSGAHEVHGAIRDLWAKLGWETSCLGYPTSDEYNSPYPEGTRQNDFQGGTIWWNAVSGAYKLCNSDVPK